MSSTFTNLDAFDLDGVSGCVDFGPAKRILANGAKFAAVGAAAGLGCGYVFGGVSGGVVNAESGFLGAVIGGAGGFVVGGVGGFGVGVIDQASREFGGR